MFSVEESMRILSLFLFSLFSGIAVSAQVSTTVVEHIGCFKVSNIEQTAPCGFAIFTFRELNGVLPGTPHPE